jgi:hypothetical protein
MTDKMQHAILSFGLMGPLLVSQRERRTEKGTKREPHPPAQRQPRKGQDWPDT